MTWTIEKVKVDRLFRVYDQKAESYIYILLEEDAECEPEFLVRYQDHKALKEARQ